ncbi:epoxide hydrolase 1 [Pendulispora brunnea]|uniref:Epoxide hydrolase 1 n=1 Tax=Pendulispora brunnea TaxID=2905690 RepID=A0ABZ2KBZ8_9BACT
MFEYGKYSPRPHFSADRGETALRSPARFAALIALFAVFVGGAACGNDGGANTDTETGAPAVVSDALASNAAIRPFRVHFPKEDLVDLRRRVLATRWPDRETVADRSQGTQLNNLQELVRYWGTDYDWRTFERKLNSLPQFKTRIEGLDIHFIHVRSRYPNALPVLLTHGWPGSIIEFLGAIDSLTDPVAHGGRAEDAFDVIIPSIPGYGFSSKPTETGWDPVHIGRVWAELMTRLGITRYVAQGGDWGAPITGAMALQKAPGLLGIHLNFPASVPPDIAKAINNGDPAPPGLSDDEKSAFESVSSFVKKQRGYAVMMETHPQSVGFGLTDSPAGLAGWVYEFNDGEPQRLLTKEQVADDLTLYWLTNTAVSSARLYWENKAPILSSEANNTKAITIPVAVTVFPNEIYRAPETWTRRAYPTLTYFSKADKGGHFAAWEQPELFSAELRAAFKSLR